MNPPTDPRTYDENTDAAVVSRMARGDEQALSALYDRWVDTVHTLAFHLLGDADEAEDVVEETFWQAWRQASRYEGSRGQVSTWLSTIARSRALDRLRSRRRRAEEPLDQPPTKFAPQRGFASDTAAAPGDAHVAAEHWERSRDVVAALKVLPADQREVIELAYFGGLSHSEIAEKTSLPLGTVKTRVRLALEKLREPLELHRGGAS
jgi:RNA polymerase sigma-70 factor (ECF subfamily)